MVLAIASIGVLIYFVDHASTIIQASHVISEVSADLNNAIERLFPEKILHSVLEHKQQIREIPANFNEDARSIKSISSGYIQAGDSHLVKIAHYAIFRLGRYALETEPESM